MSHELFGLSQTVLQTISDVIKKFPEIERSVIFGSRALGTYKRGSDIDIALFGKHLDQIVLTISYKLNEELLLPYFFDIVDYNSLNNPELKDHIDRVGIMFYTKNL